MTKLRLSVREPSHCSGHSCRNLSGSSCGLLKRDSNHVPLQCMGEVEHREGNWPVGGHTDTAWDKLELLRVGTGEGVGLQNRTTPGLGPETGRSAVIISVTSLGFSFSQNCFVVRLKMRTLEKMNFILTLSCSNIPESEKLY